MTFLDIADAHDAERLRYAEFAAKMAHKDYRHVLADLYRHWGRWNVQYFGGRLLEPHLMFGVTGPRALGRCQPLTDFGGCLQITINHKVILGQHRICRAAWPSQGIKRFIRDILLHELLHQWQFEINDSPEKSYHGHGPLFCQQCNRIGEDLDLPPVIVRRRGQKDTDQPLCSQWPLCVRPEDFYLHDVGEGSWQFPQKSPTVHYPDYLILLETILEYIRDGRFRELQAVLEDELNLIYDRRKLGVLKFRSVFT